jgi:hypothetical protein
MKGHFESMPTFYGYVLAAGVLAWLGGFGWMPLIAGGVACAVNERLACQGKRRRR